MSRKKKSYSFDRRLIAWLRREWWFRSQARKEILKESSHCTWHKCKKTKDLVVDHIVPWIRPEEGLPRFRISRVLAYEGDISGLQFDALTTDWTILINRLFCDKSNLQVLCKAHHKEKTNAENKKR